MRAIVIALVGLAAAMPATPAQGAKRNWKITGALSGGYSIQWTGSPCSTQTSESVTGLKVAVRSRRLVYDMSERSILSIQPLSLSFAAGQATFSGTIIAPDSGDCGTAQPYSCTGRIRGENGARTTGRLNLLQARRSFVGGLEDHGLVLVRGGAGGPERSPCEEMAGTTGTRGDFGPEANDHLAGILRVPRSKLAGRRAFTVVARQHDPRPGCDRFKTHCVERSNLRFALRFSRVK